MMNALTIRETVKLMQAAVEKNAGDFISDPWPRASFELIAGKTDALASLIMTKAITDDPEVVLRSAARLGEKVLALQQEFPVRLAAFEALMVSGFWQNWKLPEASEELRSVLRAMDSSKRLEAITTAIANSKDPEARKILGSVLPYGIHALTTGIEATQLFRLRENFNEKELPLAWATREKGRSLFSTLDSFLNFAGSVARDMGNPGALRQLENDRAARLAAEARLASND